MKIILIGLIVDEPHPKLSYFTFSCLTLPFFNLSNVALTKNASSYFVLPHLSNE